MRIFLADSGMSTSEIEDALPVLETNDLEITKNCYEETEPCKPPGHGSHDSGLRSRIVCEDKIVNDMRVDGTIADLLTLKIKA